jgi:hypothetical protein
MGLTGSRSLHVSLEHILVEKRAAIHEDCTLAGIVRALVLVLPMC